MKSTELTPTVTAITELLITSIPGVRPYEAERVQAQAAKFKPYSDGRLNLYVRYNHSSGNDATLQVNFEFDESAENFKVDCEMSWPTTHYSVQAGRAAVTLHAAVVNLAEVIELRYNK